MSKESLHPLVIGLAGLGTVGSGLVQLLTSNQDMIERRTGRQIRLKTVLVHDLKKPRSIELPQGVTLTTDPTQLTDDSEIDAVVEVIGGQTTAKELIMRALSQGKHVVTANKALLAENGEPIFSCARKEARILRYEASVCGAIPIVQSLKESLAGNHIQQLMGIFNGTSNYILSRMTHKKMDFATALKEAQNLGFAEADPSLDIDGFDSAHKLILLIRLAFGVDYPFKELPIQGIRNLQALDIQLASELGFHIKLIGRVRNLNEANPKNPHLDAGVFPALVPKHFLLAQVDGSFNAVHVLADAAGALFFHGRGAGDLPTASAVLADLLAVCKENQPDNTGFSNEELPLATNVAAQDASSCYYVRMMVEDAPGVLRDIAGCMAKQGISMSHVIQRQSILEAEEKLVPLVLMTHETTAKAMSEALSEINALALPKEPLVTYRVLGQ